MKRAGKSQARHQSCLAHLLRRCHEMIEAAEHGAARLPHALRRLLLAALGLRDRRRIHHPANQSLLKHLRNEAPHLFTFLGRQEVPATNYMAEQAARPAVVTRKADSLVKSPGTTGAWAEGLEWKKALADLDEEM